MTMPTAPMPLITAIVMMQHGYAMIQMPHILTNQPFLSYTSLGCALIGLYLEDLNQRKSWTLEHHAS